MTCTHEIWEKETAIADGYCPICMASPQWQPAETAPRDGYDFLAALWGGTSMAVVYYVDTDDKYPWQTLDGLGYHKDAVTHWMPLPAPPNDTPK
jgi:Protein of unknown function (DUF551)